MIGAFCQCRHATGSTATHLEAVGVLGQRRHGFLDGSPLLVGGLEAEGGLHHAVERVNSVREQVRLSSL